MQRNRILLTAVLCCSSLATPAVAKTHARRGPTSPAKASSHSHKRHSKKAAVRGPRSIDAERATQIQTALIKAGYLTGEPSGHWDAQSEAAMQKLQADNGWQTKLIPDSRALIKLGLGPATPPPPAAAPASQLNAVPPSDATASAAPLPQTP